MDPKAIRQAMTNHMNAAKALGDPYAGREGEMPDEISARIDAELGKFDECKARLESAERMASAEEFMRAPAAGPVSFRDAGATEGDVPHDPESWRSVKVAGREYRFFIPLAVQRNGDGKYDEGKAYAAAFESYLRKGRANMGPNDLKTLAEGVDTTGGFLVPPDYHAELIKKIAGLTAMRQLARVEQTSRDQAQWPRINYTTDNKYTSGVRLTWSGEQPASATAARVTDPIYGLITIPVHTAMASMPITNDLIEDAAFDVVGSSQQLLAEAFALGEDNVFLNGSGAGQPVGLMTNIDSTDYVQSTVSGTSSDISTSGDAHGGKRLNDVYYAVPAQYRRVASSAWMMNSGTLEAVDNLVDGQKRPLLMPLTQASMGAGEPVTLKSKQVYVDEFMPDIGASTFPIIFGDFSGYIILDRVGFSIQRLTELYAETNLQLLLARRRVGGFPVEPWRFRAMKAST